VHGVRRGGDADMTRDRAMDYRGIVHAATGADPFAVTACGLTGLWRDIAMSPRPVDLAWTPGKDVSCMACVAARGCP
jgi:hypothetical protein